MSSWRDGLWLSGVFGTLGGVPALLLDMLMDTVFVRALLGAGAADDRSMGPVGSGRLIYLNRS